MKIKQTIIVILLFVILATATHLVQRQIRGKLGDAPPLDVLFLPKGGYVKVIALGFDNFWADMLWIRSLQYFGGHFMYDRKYPIVDRLLDVMIDLEPSFTDVYSFGAMVLHEEAHERDKAVRYLNIGIKNNPKNWHLPYELGFLWFEEKQSARDTTYRRFAAEEAIKAYSIATSRPDCPEFVERLIYQLHFDAGDREIALQLWSEKLEEARRTGNKLVEQIMQDKIDLMLFQEVADPVQKAVFEYYKKNKKIPPTLETLVAEKFMSSIPMDPITKGKL